MNFGGFNTILSLPLLHEKTSYCFFVNRFLFFAFSIMSCTKR